MAGEWVPGLTAGHFENAVFGMIGGYHQSLAGSVPLMQNLDAVTVAGTGDRAHIQKDACLGFHAAEWML